MTTAGADKALKAWEDLIGSMEFKDSVKLYSQMKFGAANDDEKRIDVFYHEQLAGQ